EVGHEDPGDITHQVDRVIPHEGDPGDVHCLDGVGLDGLLLRGRDGHASHHRVAGVMNRPSTALLTDQYELTMVQAALHSGAARRRCVFETFARRLPSGRRYGVLAGTGRLLDAIERFRFGDAELAHLREREVVDERTLDFLADYRFEGDIWGYAEGETFFPYSPVLVVESDFAHGVILETIVLSILNHDTAVASAASRMTGAAGARPVIEMGSRRTQEEAATAAARAS